MLTVYAGERSPQPSSSHHRCTPEPGWSGSRSVTAAFEFRLECRAGVKSRDAVVRRGPVEPAVPIDVRGSVLEARRFILSLHAGGSRQSGYVEETVCPTASGVAQLSGVEIVSENVPDPSSFPVHSDHEAVAEPPVQDVTLACMPHASSLHAIGLVDEQAG